MGESRASEPADLVRRYLSLVEARDLDEAAALLAPNITITFPGNRTFGSLSEQVAASSRRFRSVHKNFDGFDTSTDGDRIVVSAFGTLHGVGLDGATFDSVRFIDRFVLSEGRILDHMVWNDLAELGIVATD